jgi:hypothetical protein
MDGADVQRPPPSSQDFIGAHTLGRANKEMRLEPELLTANGPAFAKSYGGQARRDANKRRLLIPRLVNLIPIRVSFVHSRSGLLFFL